MEKTDGLTEKEKAIYDYIAGITRRDGFSPSIRDIQNALLIKSTSTVHSYLDRLEKKGYIQKETGKSRTLRAEPAVTGAAKKTVKIPVLHRINNGVPVFASENFNGYIDFPLPPVFSFANENSAGKYPQNYLFAYMIRNSAMRDAGVMPGDAAVFVKEAYAGEDINIAAVLTDGEIRLVFTQSYEFDAADMNGSVIIGRMIGLLRYY